MSRLTCVLAAAAVVAGPALAQSESVYDPDRNCRTYVLQHLPVPVRCMAELHGNWAAKPYIDGEFMFRSRQEWLTWKDREDYRHWKQHDFDWHPGMTPAPVATPVPPPVGRAAALPCPSEIRLTLDRSSAEGWISKDGGLMLRLDPSARTDGGTLFCSYGAGRITLARPAWGHCTARKDGTGFDCAP